ncbi:MAG: leucine-rich repeat domain-containing protein [Bacilli bacterium]|jgi:hypothetical protein
MSEKLNVQKKQKAQIGTSKKKKFNLKKFLLIFGSCSLVAAALVVGYAALINFYLLDYENMEYIEFSYLINNDESQETTIRIDRVYPNSAYPDSFRIPNRLLGYRVTEIGNGAFGDLNRLTSVSFPNSIYSIGEEAFAGCTNLSSFNVPYDLTYIGTDAFAETAFLANQADGEVLIGDILYQYKGEVADDTAIVASQESEAYTSHAFSNYIFLNDIVMIGSGAFKGKSNLSYVEYPSKFASLPSRIFESCPNLDTVILGDDIVKIGDYAFNDCESLSDINWPTKLLNIGAYAFSNCALNGELDLPDSISSIGDYAFAENSFVTSFKLPSSTYRVSDGLVKDCSNLSSFVYDNPSSGLADSQIVYFGSEALSGTSLTSFTIPYNVDTIKNSLFKDCTKLETVKISESNVLIFENFVFDGCTSFKTLQLIDSIGNAVSPSDEVKLPSSTLIFGDSSGSSYMLRNTAITTLDLTSAKIYYLPDSMCYGCTDLTSVLFPSEDCSIVSVFSRAFAGCTSLASIELPSSIISVYQYAFEGCTSLSSIVCDTTSVTSLTIGVFSGCSALSSFVIPGSVTVIDSNSFAGCTSLPHLVIPATVRTINKNAFVNISASFKLFLMNTTGSLPSNYASDWNSDGASGHYDYYFYSETAPTESNKYWHYVSGVPSVWTI